MINGEIKGGTELQYKFENTSQNLRAELAKAVFDSAFNLQNHIVGNKLNGQVLNVKSGRLRRSITTRITGQGTSEVVGMVGTNLEYARAHEYGFQGTVTVKEHLRQITKAWGKSIKNPRKVKVSAHPMKMNMKERLFLRPALEEMRPAIDARIQQAVQQAIDKAK